MKYPFEVPYSEVVANVDGFIDAVFNSLRSSFLLLPRGAGFVTYQDFQQAYEVLKRHTGGFSVMNADSVLAAFQEDALILIVVRAILGFTPPEWPT